MGNADSRAATSRLRGKRICFPSLHPKKDSLAVVIDVRPFQVADRCKARAGHQHEFNEWLKVRSQVPEQPLLFGHGQISDPLIGLGGLCALKIDLGHLGAVHAQHVPQRPAQNLKLSVHGRIGGFGPAS